MKPKRKNNHWITQYRHYRKNSTVQASLCSLTAVLSFHAWFILPFQYNRGDFIVAGLILMMALGVFAAVKIGSSSNR